MACLYVALLAAFYVGQRRLLYHPTTVEVAPAERDLKGFTTQRLAVSEGDQVVTWHAAPTTKAETILYLHGNGGSLASRAHRFEFLQQQGYGVAALSYRGYGGTAVLDLRARLRTWRMQLRSSIGCV